MQYIQPFGNPDTNASYIDRNSSAGQAGSAVPAAAIEHPMREIAAVIAAGGLTPSRADLTQLLQAIQHLISAATGGGDTSNFVLMPQARARLPIFPEVLTSDGIIPVISPAAGAVRVPAGYDFLHRGIYVTTTAQTDFATVASKTYHLRWRLSGGFVLKDLADVAYNPSAAAETAVTFDSTYDDMLVARVVTSAGNVPTITNLINKNVLTASGEALAPGTFGAGFGSWEDATMPSAIVNFTPVAINFARRPDAYLSAFNDFWVKDTTVAADERNVGVRARNRYQVELWAQGDSDMRIAWAARA
ncbi:MULTISPECIES: hypothetical protein [unclassified Rhizobium]|uniref:hypothetical protein n=1 Tax=unclassified Rhizobium TaxID=2613769 RepID=UPI001469EC45|nr:MULTISPECIES: hypothetical protein [unclassified Rhizobium]MBD9445750.1 hypothetical protein [Rhizobium sp. RHZ01]NMN73850.1 hypothetical protein [Rhizobium sp. 57MFTsu3.2]